MNGPCQLPEGIRDPGTLLPRRTRTESPIAKIRGQVAFVLGTILDALSDKAIATFKSEIRLLPDAT